MICPYAKDQYDAKYQLLVNKLESVSLKHFDDLKAFIEYSSDIDDVYESINEYNWNKKRKTFIVFDYIIVDIFIIIII